MSREVTKGITAIIPARGGSKRIPGKNVRPFLGTPIILRVLQTLKSLPEVCRVVVSTDDESIALLVGQECEVLERPHDLADDHTPTWPVVVHAIDALGLSHQAEESVACVYPTAVLVNPQTLRRAFLLLFDEPDTYVFPAVRFSFPPQRAFTIDEGGRSRMLDSAHYFARSQDLVPVYHDAGQFYLATIGTWLAHERFFEPGYPLIIPEIEAQDIDTDSDWNLAELKYQLLHQSE
jgi:pseudaminic acid cytidylyltransferase